MWSRSIFNALVIYPCTIATIRHRIRNRLLNTYRHDLAQSLSWVSLVPFVHIHKHQSRTSVQLCLHQQPVSPRRWHTYPVGVFNSQYCALILSLSHRWWDCKSSPTPWQCRYDSAFVCPVTQLPTTRARTMEPPPGQQSRHATPCHDEICRHKNAAAILTTELLVPYSDNPVLFKEVRHFADTTMKRSAFPVRLQIRWHDPGKEPSSTKKNSLDTKP